MRRYHLVVQRQDLGEVQSLLHVCGLRGEGDLRGLEHIAGDVEVLVCNPGVLHRRTEAVTYCF